MIRTTREEGAEGEPVAASMVGCEEDEEVVVMRDDHFRRCRCQGGVAIKE
jgi:hypothetical protein